MALMHTPVCDFGQPAHDFSLPDPDGRTWTLDDCRGANGTLVMFICNHCPYVKAIGEQLVDDTRALLGHGVRSVAIMPNDPPILSGRCPRATCGSYPKVLEFSFPYLIDESQTVARAYGAVCTPDFFGYDEALTLQYRGRLDATRRADRRHREPARTVGSHEAGRGHRTRPGSQIASLGCSIKWRRRPRLCRPSGGDDLRALR